MTSRDERLSDEYMPLFIRTDRPMSILLGESTASQLRPLPKTPEVQR